MKPTVSKDKVVYVTSMFENDPNTLGTLDDFTIRLANEEAIIREQRTKVLLNPKPKWLPNFVYRKVLKKLIRYEEST